MRFKSPDVFAQLAPLAVFGGSPRPTPVAYVWSTLPLALAAGVIEWPVLSASSWLPSVTQAPPE